MEKKKRQKGIWWYASLGLAIAGGAVMGYQIFLWVFAQLLLHRAAPSLGVIGGADGPTAVFVSGTSVTVSGFPGELITAGLLLLVGVGGCLFFSRKRK